MDSFTFALRLFERFVLRDIRRNLLRTVLTICGITLGVAVFLAISIANDTALARFRQTVGQVAGKANLELIPLSGASIDESAMRDLLVLSRAGVKWTPLIDEHIVIDTSGASGSSAASGASADTGSSQPTDKSEPESPASSFESKDREIVQLIGLDMLADPDFKSYQSSDESQSVDTAVQGPTDSTAESAPAKEYSVFAPYSVLVGGALADRLSLKPGSQIKTLLAERDIPLTVAGVLSKEGLGGAYSGNLIVADMALAQELTQLEGRVSRVDMIVPDDVSIEDLSQKLSTSLPADVMVASPDTRSAQAEKMTRSFEYNLLALTLIALMVGMFLIYNTMTITVLRRRPDIGVLRALGVKRSTILNMFLWEALFLGGLGTLGGIVLGGVMAQGALRAVAQTFQYFYFKVPLEKVTVNPEQYMLAFAIGMGLTLLAALPPLYESTTVAPSEATRRASYESKMRGFAPLLFVLGLVSLVLCYISSLQGPVQDFPLFGYLAAFLSIVGASLLMPLSLTFILPPVAKIFSRIFGAPGRVAASSLQGTLTRTAVAAASLMIGIAMMISLAIMISSFRKTVTQWIDQSFQADLWMQSQARASGNKMAKLPESLLPVVDSVPGVAAAEGFVDRRITYQGMPVFLGAADFDILAKYGNQLFTSGASNKAVCEQMVGDRAIISEPFAVRRGLKKGDSLELQVEGGKHTFVVTDVFYDYASDLGYIIIPRDVYKSLYHDDTISNAAIYLEPGASLDTVKDQILKLTNGKARLTINSTRELRAQAITIFDRTFAITYALHTIAVIVSMLSVMNALFALTIESKREFAILRYLGASRKLLSRIVYLQAAVLALVGNFGGLGLGYVLSLLLTHVINKQSFGWSVQYSIPWDFIAQSTVLVLVTAVASAAVPASMAARTLAPSVIRDE